MTARARVTFSLPRALALAIRERARKEGQPISRVVEDALRIARGDYAMPCSVHGPDAPTLNGDGRTCQPCWDVRRG